MWTLRDRSIRWSKHEPARCFQQTWAQMITRRQWRWVVTSPDFSTMTASTSPVWTSHLTRTKVSVWPLNVSKWRRTQVRRCDAVGLLLQLQPIISSNSRAIIIEFHRFCSPMRTIWSIWATSIKHNSLHRQILRRRRSLTASKSRLKGTELQGRHPFYQEIQDQQLILSLRTRCFNRAKHQSANREIVSGMQIYSPR